MSETSKDTSAFFGDDQLLFELRGPDGQEWKLFANGEACGFPEGTFMINHAWPLFCALRCLARKEDLPASGITGHETKPDD